MPLPGDGAGYSSLSMGGGAGGALDDLAAPVELLSDSEEPPPWNASKLDAARAEEALKRAEREARKRKREEEEGGVIDLT